MNKKELIKRVQLQKYEPLLDKLKEQEGFELSEDDIDDWLTCVLDDTEVEYREYGLQTISYSKFIHGYLYEYTMNEVEKDYWEYNLKLL